MDTVGGVEWTLNDLIDELVELQDKYAGKRARVAIRINRVPVYQNSDYMFYVDENELDDGGAEIDLVLGQRL